MPSQPTCIAYLIDTISCNTAGTQRQLLESIRRLNKERFAPHIICLHSSPWMERNELPCPVTVLGYRGFLKWNILSVVLKLRRFVRDRPVQILQTFFDESVFIAFLATLDMRRRCVLLSSRRDMGLGSTRPWYHRLFALALPYVNKHFDAIISNGYEIKKWVAQRERVSPDKIFVIPNGITLTASTNDIPELLREHTATLWIGMVASLTPIKRIDVFIRALGIMRQKRPDIHFQAALFGEGPERETLLALSQQERVADRIHFIGVVNNVSPYLSHMDIGVLCSDREGLPNAILEYMAHAIPVVATAAGGNAELVDSRVGLLVPPGDAAALADAMLRLADNPCMRHELGKAGRNRVSINYSWNRTMTQLESTYSRMLAVKLART